MDNIEEKIKKIKILSEIIKKKKEERIKKIIERSMAEKIGGSKINQPFVSNYSLSTTPANPISEKKDYYSEAESNKINDKNNSEESPLNYENKETKKYVDKIKSIVLSDKSSSDEKKNNSDESSKSSSNEDGYDDGEKTTDSEKKD